MRARPPPCLSPSNAAADDAAVAIAVIASRAEYDLPTASLTRDEPPHLARRRHRLPLSGQRRARERYVEGGARPRPEGLGALRLGLHLLCSKIYVEATGQLKKTALRSSDWQR